MKLDIADRWVAALESGEYMKGRSRLCGKTGSGHTVFCCLGVLSELAIQDGVPVEKEWLCGEENFPFALYDGVRGVLPERVKEWAGMGSRGGRFFDGEEPWVLTEINDNTNDFGEVIEAIRNHAEEL